MCFHCSDPWADNIIVAQIIIADHTYIVRYSTTDFANGIDGSSCLTVIKCKQGSRHFACVSVEKVQAHLFSCVIKPGACF